MASLRSILRLFTLAGGLAGLIMVSAGASAGVTLPQLERGKGERCVEDTEVMRRNHMDMLKHQRDKTMRQGIRTTKHSLKGCVECHASSTTGSVASSKDDFCAACHVFTGVKLDCWDCHATKPKAKSAQAIESQASPMMSTVQTGGAQ
jgi:hypothetical protein